MSEQRPGVGNAVMPREPGAFNLPRDIRAPRVGMPAAVAEAVENHARVLGLAQDARDAELVAKKAAEMAEARDIVEDAERVVAGAPPLTARERQLPKTLKALEYATRERQVAQRAAASTANTLETAIKTNRGEWEATLAAELAAARAELDEALRAVEKASARFAAVGGAHAWVASVTAREIPMGVSTGRFVVRVGNHDYAGSEVVAAIRKAALPPEVKSTPNTPGVVV